MVTGYQNRGRHACALVNTHSLFFDQPFWGIPVQQIKEYFDTQLDEGLAEQIARVCCLAFTASKRTFEERVVQIMSSVGSNDPELVTGRRFVIWQNDQAIAHASTFVRKIFSGDREIPVLALAGVCSDPGLQGQGLGAQVTRRAFQQIGQDGWPDVSLFQTGVPGFYEKLDSRIVNNRFVNLRCTVDPQANPWRDEVVMIYPGTFDWPDGVIDMNGPDY